MISGYMICYNEQTVIEISVRNMLKFVDELIICDGESTDNTIDILNRMSSEFNNMRIITVKQQYFREKHDTIKHMYTQDGFNEVERRNAALELCRGDFILTKDADELFPNINFKHLATSGHLTYSQSQYCVDSRDLYLKDVHSEVTCDTPRFFKMAPGVHYGNRDGDHYAKGVDCVLKGPNGQMYSRTRDMPGAVPFFHYKMILAPNYRDWHKDYARATMPFVPDEHNEMMDKIEKERT